MEKLIIEPAKELRGEALISGAKNSALPILIASTLAKGEYSISNIPNLRDIRTMFKLLNILGVETEYNASKNIAYLKNDGNSAAYEAPYELVKTMRASILALGPVLAKKGKAKISLPGGCAIGARPVDLHISALQKMGANIDVQSGYIYADCNKLKGCEIVFDKITVTGTENIIMAATLAEGETILKNVAMEPEVVDLVTFLRGMGAEIYGEGSSVIRIVGKESLQSANYCVMPDRIEAGTFLCAIAGVGGEITLKNAPAYAMDAVIGKLKEAGLSVDFEVGPSLSAQDLLKPITLKAKMSGEIKATNIKTMPFPAFPTDMQAQFMASMLKSNGTSVINESIFENRFMHVPELVRMGADITLQDSSAIVKGVKFFSGAHVMASDLRASAGLVIAALMAENASQVHRIYHLDRGYDGFEKKLELLGAKIVRDKDDML